jgi:putative oxidoreductase
MMSRVIFRFFSLKSLFPDFGLLVIRVGIGLSMLIFHGYGKITGGAAAWERIGANMANLGITFAPGFWGFMAALSEAIGSLCIVLGIFFRPATALLVCTMIVASVRHLSLPPDAAGAGWKGASHALELLAVYAALFAAGPGRYVLRKPGPSSS